MLDREFIFTEKLWIWQGPSAWHFITLPKEAGEEIHFFKSKKAGFGSVRVKATIGETQWKTSIFPDKESGSFLLPVKAEVRKKEHLHVGDDVEVKIFIDFN